MPVNINGQTYFRTAEVCTRAGISRSTLFRWLKEGVIREMTRDRRGWRIFSESDLTKLKAEVKRTNVERLPAKKQPGNRPG